MKDPRTIEDFANIQEVFALVIAKTIRNALEDLHGGDVEDSLTDAQMAKINPIVRDATVSALATFELAKRGHRGAVHYVNWALSSVPGYWEPPMLLDDFADALEGMDKPIGEGLKSVFMSWVIIDQADCKNCGEPIFQFRGVAGKLFGEETWTHTDVNRSRGCQTASYDSNSRPYPHYDESLSKTAKATPKRGWKAA